MGFAESERRGRQAAARRLKPRKRYWLDRGRRQLPGEPAGWREVELVDPGDGGLATVRDVAAAGLAILVDPRHLRAHRPAERPKVKRAGGRAAAR